MKRKFNFLMFAFIAVLACLSFASCDKDDDPVAVDNYYLQLSEVSSNLVDANGNSLTSALITEWIDAFKADSQGKIAIGKYSDEKSAENGFYKNLDNIVASYNNAYAGKDLLPDDGFFTLKFYLLKEKTIITSASIRVTNSGASY